MKDENKVSWKGLNSGPDFVPSKKGYVNREEFVKGFRNSGKWAVAIAALTAAAVETGHYLLVNLGKIYTGPGSAPLAAIAGTAALIIRLRWNVDKSLAEGEDDGPILFPERQRGSQK